MRPVGLTQHYNDTDAGGECSGHGPAFAGRRREHDRLLIALPADAAAREFDAGALIEIRSEEAIYLGAVLHRQDLHLAISVEHAVNRSALADIEDAWRDR